MNAGSLDKSPATITWGESITLPHLGLSAQHRRICCRLKQNPLQRRQRLFLTQSHLDDAVKELQWSRRLFVFPPSVIKTLLAKTYLSSVNGMPGCCRAKGSTEVNA